MKRRKDDFDNENTAEAVLRYMEYIFLWIFSAFAAMVVIGEIIR